MNESLLCPQVDDLQAPKLFFHLSFANLVLSNATIGQAKHIRFGTFFVGTSVEPRNCHAKRLSTFEPRVASFKIIVYIWCALVHASLAH